MASHPVSSPRSDTAIFPHWMLREISEQSHAIRECVRRHVSGSVIFPTALHAIEHDLVAFRKIIIAASGSSRHAGLAGEIMLENLSGIAVDVEYSSEYSYRSADVEADDLVLLITQSGETADTIAAQREALKRGAKTLAISNVPGSTIGREAHAELLSHAGPEKAVPATKSFTTQLTVLYLLALFLAQKRGRMGSALDSHLEQLSQIPEAIQSSLANWQVQAEQCARAWQSMKAFLFLGRGIHYAIAREGALKLKETSYVHAEGLPTGEFRHGTNALIDENLAVISLCTRDHSAPDSMLRYEKTFSVLENVKARGGKILVVANEDDQEITALADSVIAVPAAPELLLPLLEVVPLQLFAYHFAVLNGCDVDNPRNLVKSVISD